VIPELCCTPVHLNEIEFAVVLGVEIANMTLVCDEFLKRRFLICKIRLTKESLSTAASCGSLLALEARALSQLSWLEKIPFMEDLLHPLKPPRHHRMIGRPIQFLN
jgi:hypothetical protein